MLADALVVLGHSTEAAGAGIDEHELPHANPQRQMNSLPLQPRHPRNNMV